MAPAADSVESLSDRSLPPTEAPPVLRGDEDHVARVQPLVDRLGPEVRGVGVTERFKDVIRTFSTSPGQTPAGFRVEAVPVRDESVRFDLVRDIGYDRDGIRRPTQLIFSVDSANPYEVAPFAGLIGNLTCNPGIVYDLFVNDPMANPGRQFTTLEQVLEAAVSSPLNSALKGTTV